MYGLLTASWHSCTAPHQGRLRPLHSAGGLCLQRRLDALHNTAILCWQAPEDLEELSTSCPVFGRCGSLAERVSAKACA